MTEAAQLRLDLRLQDIIIYGKEHAASDFLHDTCKRCNRVLDNLGRNTLSELSVTVFVINDFRVELNKAKTAFEQARQNSQEVLPAKRVEEQTIHNYRDYQDPIPVYETCMARIARLVEILYLQMRIVIVNDVKHIAGSAFDLKRAIGIAAALGENLKSNPKSKHVAIAKALVLFGEKHSAPKIGIKGFQVGEEEFKLEGVIDTTPVFMGMHKFIESKMKAEIPSSQGLSAYLLVGDSLFSFSLTDFMGDLKLGSKFDTEIKLDGTLGMVCGSSNITYTGVQSDLGGRLVRVYMNEMPQADADGKKLALVFQLSLEIAKHCSAKMLEIRCRFMCDETMSKTLKDYNFEQVPIISTVQESVWKRDLEQNPPRKQIFLDPWVVNVFKDFPLTFK